MPNTPNQRTAGVGWKHDFRIYDSLMSVNLSITMPPPAATPTARVFALIPCAGQGSRALAGKAGVAKQYQRIAGRPMVAHTLDAFTALGAALAGLCVVISPDDDVFESSLPDFSGQLLRCGGATRAATVENGLAAMVHGGARHTDWVMVHDAARCLIAPDLITALMHSCLSHELGGLLAQPLADTLKMGSAGAGGLAQVAQTLPRTDKWLAQTPQMFRIGALAQALELAREQGLDITDESSAMEAQGGSPLLVPGSALNFKVTYPQDFALAEAVLRARQP